MYNQRKTTTAAAISVLDSGIVCSFSTSVVMTLMVSAEHDVGEDAVVLIVGDNASLSLLTGHENSRPTSLRCSMSVSGLSIQKAKICKRKK